MKQYEIKKVASFDELKKSPVIEIDHSYPAGSPDGVTAHAQIGYSDQAILVHLWAEEAYTRAVEQGVLGIPCEDSCLEFFFCPMEGDGRYFNVEFNSNGCYYLGFGSNIHNLMRLVPEEPFFAPKIEKKDGGWEIFYEIPYEFIRYFFPDFTVYAGKEIKANCYKCSDLTEPPHYFSWSPILGDPFTFHRTEGFGTMTFTE